MRRLRRSGLPVPVLVALFVAAFHPNCYCCPADSNKMFGCNGCDRDGGCSKHTCRGVNRSGCNAGRYGQPEGSDAGEDLYEAGSAERGGSAPVPPVGRRPTPAPSPQLVGGTLAILEVESQTFTVAAVPSLGLVRVVHVAETDWPEDPLALRTVGDATFPQDAVPGRVVGGDGLAYVALQGVGAVAVLDPTTAKVRAQRTVCDGPRALAVDTQRTALHVACAAGEVITLDAKSLEPRRSLFVARGLEELAVLGDELVASDRSRLFLVHADGSISAQPAPDIGLLRPPVGASLPVALAQSGHATSVLNLSEEGKLGPALLVHTDRLALHDLSVTAAGDTLVAAGGDAFFLPSSRTPQATAFTALGAPGVTTAVAQGRAGKQGFLTLQTEAPRALHFLTVAGEPAFVAMERLP